MGIAYLNEFGDYCLGLGELLVIFFIIFLTPHD